MNPLKLNKKQIMFCMTIMFVTFILGLLLLVWNNELKYAVMIMIPLATFLGGLISKFIFPDSEN